MLVICTAVYGQQRPLYSFFDDNITAINPSLPRTEFIFEDYSLFVNATHRNQWIGFDKAPSTFLVQATTWLPDWSNNFYELLGNTHVGIDILQDATPPFYQSAVYGRLGHLVYLNHGGRYRRSKTFIAGGLNVGLIWQRIKRQDLGSFVDAPELGGLASSATSPDVGFGISFNHYFTRTGRDFGDSQGFFVGFSVPQTLQFDLNHATDDGSISVKKIRHYNYVIGGQLGADSENLKVRPMVLVTHIPTAPLFVNGHVEMTLQEYFMIGFGMDSSLGISARVGFNIPMNGPKNSNGDAIRFAFGYSRIMSAHNAGSSLEFTATYMIDFQEY